MTQGLAQTPPRPEPECIVLGPRPGKTPSSAPPVRIFLGTEPSQYRAERVFLWSIERVRDPSRVYEVYLMKAMSGFRRLFWNTGFTNYRFAIPHWAGFAGRAIYNDVDQVYLTDPAELFDRDMGSHAYLAVSQTDTSVMLMDCARLEHCWSLRAAQRRRKYGLIARALDVEDGYGHLPAEWNARDDEYQPGRTHLVHYTILHRQPWRPFPERFYYQPHTVGDVWLGLEREADAAGFHIFGPARPSRALAELVPAPATAGGLTRAALDEAVAEVVRRTGSRTVLDVRSGRDASAEAWGAERVEAVPLDELLAAAATGDGNHHDGVVVDGGLDQLPAADLPWIVERLFARADRFVLASVRCARPPRPRRTGPPVGTINLPEWWRWMFETAASRHPEVHWRLAVTYAPSFDDASSELHQGGAFVGRGRPRVWVLLDHKPGHTTQSLGLAQELGWAHEVVQLDFNALSEIPNVLVRGTLRSLKAECARLLAPPWPDLVIATGRRTAPIASWIRTQSRGLTRSVQMGRIGAFEGDRFDLAVAPAYACLYPDPRRVETAAPVTRVSPTVLEQAASGWSREFGSAAKPRIALLVGGSNAEHELTPDHAREMGRRVAALAEREGGSVLVTTSRRTSRAAGAALEEALGEVCTYFHRWEAELPPEENPYLGLLALADALVVTGESGSMLAEACATGKPVYIYPLPGRSRGLKAWARGVERVLADAVAARAFARPVNRRGIERPQRGLQRLCAGLLARGFVRTSGHSRMLHQVLVERGLARIFDGTIAPAPAEHLSEVSAVAERVRRLMGVGASRSERNAIESAADREASATTAENA